MQRGYDMIAPVYDTFARLIFGNALRNAQTRFLSLIPSSSTILIAGGGTGWILEEITRIHQEGLHIVYLDSSAKMIEKAKKRDAGKNEVRFLNQSVLQWQAHVDFDIIITPFFFDNFSQENTEKVFTLFHAVLKTDGLWLHTDFQISAEKPQWQKMLLSGMYLIFRLLANIEASRLPDVASRFRLHNYQLLKDDSFFRHFIMTSVYKKLISDG